MALGDWTIEDYIALGTLGYRIELGNGHVTRIFREEDKPSEGSLYIKSNGSDHIIAQRTARRGSSGLR